MSSSSLESCPQAARPAIASQEFVPLRGPRGQALDVNAQIQLHILCDKCKVLGEVLQELSESSWPSRETRSSREGSISPYKRKPSRCTGSISYFESLDLLETISTSEESISHHQSLDVLETISTSEESMSHYQSLDLLRDSFKRGCHLCTVLWHSLYRERAQQSMNGERCDMTDCILTMEAERWVFHVNVVAQIQIRGHHDDTLSPYEARGGTMTTVQVLSNVQGLYPRRPITMTISSISTKGGTSRSFYKKCLELCDNTHTKCRVNRVSQLPTRLLHIAPNRGSTDDTPSVRLILTGPEFSKDTKFAALSYCWGGRHGLQLEESNYQSLMKHIPFNELPATVQDSIMVTIELGMQYLWVDALCIIQNQDSNKDWSYEAGKMCDVYQGCSVAIAASGASNSREGLFAVRDPLRQTECVISTSLMTVTPDSDCAQSYWPLETRGWALQEEILPARSIKFGSYVKWNCRELSVDEFGHIEDDPVGESAFPRDFFSQIVESPTVNPVDEGEIYKLWQRIFYRYTRTKLSYTSDRLAAIEGLRSAFQQRTGWAYAYGLWQPFIMRELLWTRTDIAEPNGLRPSWSWVSMDGELSPHLSCWWTEAKCIDTAKYVGVSPSSSGRVNFDSLVKLELSGVLFQTYEPAVGRHPRFQRPPVPRCSQDWATVYEIYDDKTRIWRKGDMALPLLYEPGKGSLAGLIVVPFRDSGAFERVGSFGIGSSCDPWQIERAQVELLARSLDRGEQEPFVRRNIQLV